MSYWLPTYLTTLMSKIQGFGVWIPLLTLHWLGPVIGSLIIIATFPFGITYLVTYLMMFGPTFPLPQTERALARHI
jgi:hypothetical protein